ncbi:MAG: tetratricopeptide repeat protein [Bacteroidota bacterium]
MESVMLENAEIQSITEKIDALNARARELQTDLLPEGQLVAEEALALAEKESYLKGIIEALLVLSWRNYLKGNYPLMLEQSERALGIAEKTSDKAGEARACNNVGVMYFSTSKYSQALEYWMRSLTIWEEIENKGGIGNALGNIGNVYGSTGDFSKALECYMRSLSIREETGDKHGISASLGNIGNVYDWIGDFGKALEYFMRSLRIDEEIGNKRGIAAALNNIGVISERTGDLSKALEYHMRSLTLKEEAGDTHGIAYSLGNIGSVYYNTGDYDKALEYHMRSLTAREEIDDTWGIASSLADIGETYAVKTYTGHDVGKAIEYLLKGLAMSEEINSKALVFNVHKILSDVYEQTLDWKSSQMHFKKYHLLKEEVHNEETSKKITTLETQRKFAEIEKEREIERREQKATYKILNKIFPRSVVDRLRDGESPLADYYPDTTILFLDLVDFTTLSSNIPPRQLLYLLNSIFATCDKVIAEHGLEKIKTIGDAYMAASGVPEQTEDHLLKAAQASLQLLKALQELVVNIPQDIEGDRTWMSEIGEIRVRIGLHCGEVIGGVIGETKYAYDLWGDTVNIAARMESTGEPDKIHVSEEVFKSLKDNFEFEERGEIEIKGKGIMKTYFLLNEKDRA